MALVGSLVVVAQQTLFHQIAEHGLAYFRADNMRRLRSVSCKPILKFLCSRAWEICPLYPPETLMAFVLEKSTTKCDLSGEKDRTEHMIPLAEKLTTGGVDRRG